MFLNQRGEVLMGLTFLVFALLGLGHEVVAIKRDHADQLAKKEEQITRVKHNYGDHKATVDKAALLREELRKTEATLR